MVLVWFGVVQFREKDLKMFIGVEKSSEVGECVGIDYGNETINE